MIVEVAAKVVMVTVEVMVADKDASVIVAEGEPVGVGPTVVKTVRVDVDCTPPPILPMMPFDADAVDAEVVALASVEMVDPGPPVTRGTGELVPVAVIEAEMDAVAEVVEFVVPVVVELALGESAMRCFPAGRGPS